MAKMKSVGLMKDTELLSSIAQGNVKDSGQRLDGLLSKVAYHDQLQQIDQFIDTVSVGDNRAIQDLKLTVDSHKQQFSSVDGQELGPSSADYNQKMNELSSVVNNFKVNLKHEFSSSNSTFRNQLNTIKGDVLKSTETYVKSGEFDHQKMVADFYQSSTQMVNYAVGKRKTSIMSQIQKHEPQLNQDQVQEKFDRLTKLFTEKHFHLMASTIQGDQYIKGWNSGGRADSEITSDIQQLLGNNQVFVQDVSRSYDTLLAGLSDKISESSQQLVESAFQNDSMMASMKAIHEMTQGFESFVDGLGQKDLQSKSLKSLATDINQTYQMLNHFKDLSTEFVVGEHSLTHLSKDGVQAMVLDTVQANQFTSEVEKTDFTTKMTDYVMGRLEAKGSVDSADKDYGTVNLSKLANLQLKDASLLKMAEFRPLNEDKTQNSFGKVTSRGPYNRGFVAFSTNGSGLLSSHFQQGGDGSLNSIGQLVENLTSGVDLVDSDGIDHRSEINGMLTKYTDSLLKKEGVVATGDKGMIREMNAKSYFSNDTSFILKSKKSDFLNSELYRTYSKQFDSIAPNLERKINDTIKTGLQQGQAGKLRSLVKDLKSRPRKWLSENMSFKAKVAKNRLYSLFTGSGSSDDVSDLKSSLEKSAKTINNLTADNSFEGMSSNARSQLTAADASATDQLGAVSSESAKAIDDVNKQMTQIQGHIDSLLKSDLNKQLLNVQGAFNSGDGDIGKASAQLKSSIASAERELQSLKDVLVSAGHIALDHVDDILMSVPYLGELYSALAVANDIQGGYFASQEMSAMQNQINTVTGFNRYVASDSINPSNVGDNVAAFSTFMKAEHKRDEAAFSLLVHVGNALSPPGVNVGSVLKAVKDVVNLPELSDSDMNMIAKEVMTVNQHYQSLATTAKADGLINVMNSLGSGQLSDFTTAVFDVSFHLPTANDFTQTLNQKLFN